MAEKISPELFSALEELAYSDEPWGLKKRLQELLKSLEVGEVEEAPKKRSESRTGAQNRALHLWLTMVAEELDKNGHTIQNVVEKIRKAEIRPTKDNLKEVMWKPYQMAALKKESTTQLTKHEVDIVYEGLNKFLGQEFEIHIPWPHEEKTNVRLSQIENLKNDNYPEYTGEPTI